MHFARLTACVPPFLNGTIGGRAELRRSWAGNIVAVEDVRGVARQAPGQDGVRVEVGQKVSTHGVVCAWETRADLCSTCAFICRLWRRKNGSFGGGGRKVGGVPRLIRFGWDTSPALYTRRPFKELCRGWFTPNVSFLRNDQLNSKR